MFETEPNKIINVTQAFKVAIRHQGADFPPYKCTNNITSNNDWTFFLQGNTSLLLWWKAGAENKPVIRKDSLKLKSTLQHY